MILAQTQTYHHSQWRCPHSLAYLSLHTGKGMFPVPAIVVFVVTPKSARSTSILPATKSIIKSRHTFFIKSRHTFDKATIIGPCVARQRQPSFTNSNLDLPSICITWPGLDISLRRFVCARAPVYYFPSKSRTNRLLRV